jgi:hypothetical protein
MQEGFKQRIQQLEKDAEKRDNEDDKALKLLHTQLKQAEDRVEALEAELLERNIKEMHDVDSVEKV